MAQCTAKCKATQQRCRDTSVKGKTVCWHHGGASQGRPPTHGRYSKSVPRDLAERYEYFKTDPGILSLIPDIALARTMMERFMSNWQEGKELEAADCAEMRAWFDNISKIVERHSKIEYGERYTITVQGVSALMATVIDTIRTVVNEHLDTSEAEAVCADIGRRLAGILPGGAGGGAGTDDG